MILILDKVDFEKSITKDKEEHYIMIEGSIQEDNITFVNIYAPNVGAPKLIKQVLIDIKGKIDNTIQFNSIQHNNSRGF